MRKIMSIASLAVLVAASLLGTPRAADANFPDGATGAWADQVGWYLPGLTRGGEALSGDVTNPWQALGVAESAEPEIVIPASSAVSLGFRGKLMVKFDNTLINTAGNDLRIVAARVENPDLYRGQKLNQGTVLVEASQNCWKFYPIARVTGSRSIDLKIRWAKCIQITDLTSKGYRSAESDGYTLDGILALHTIVDQPYSGTLYDSRYWTINESTEDDTWLNHTLKSYRGEPTGFCNAIWDQAIAFNNNWNMNSVDGNGVAFQDVYFSTFGKSMYDGVTMSELRAQLETMTCNRRSHIDRGMSSLYRMLRQVNKGYYLFSPAVAA